MRQRKTPSKTKANSLVEYLNQYDSVTLIGMIQTFESSPAWDIFRSYLKLRQREFEVASLDLVKYGKTHESSHASGYAQGVGDISDNLMQEFKNFALGKSQLIENPRPDEAEV